MSLKVAGNIAQLLSERVQANPHGRCLVYTRDGIDRVLTFAQLEEECDSIAHGMRTFGVRPGDRVLVMEPPGPQFIAIVFALFKLGSLPVLIDPGMGVGPLLKCIERLRPDILVGVQRIHLLRTLHPGAFASIRRAICSDGRWVGASPLWRIRARGGERFSPYQTRPDQVAAILFTSGSTGPAKGVEFRHEVFQAQVRALSSMFDFRPGEVDMPGFPLFALFSTALGMTSVLPELNPARPASANPARLVRSILDWQVANLQGSPAIWEKVARYCLDYGISLPSLRRVITFGAPISPDFLESWKKLLGSQGEVYTPYGATEALPISLTCASEVLGEAASHSREGGGTLIGKPVSGVQVKLIRTSDEAIQEWDESLVLEGVGEIGEITVSAEQVTWAYDDDPDATRLSKIVQGDRVWHRMGDLGYFDGQGRLWIVGRKSQRIQGPKQIYYPVCAEGIANQHPDVLRSALIGLGRSPEQKPAIVLQLKKKALLKDVAERNRVRRQVLELLAEHPVYGDVTQVFFHKDFPMDRRHNAKIDRETLASWAARQSGEKDP